MALSEYAIRPATESDLPVLQKLYEVAREYMRLSGNPSQWPEGYPSGGRLKQDIANKDLYVVVHSEGVIEAAFAFHVGVDPTYAKIWDGPGWNPSESYGTIHRLASFRRHKGLGRYCVEWCAGRVSDLRIDTHEKNASLQHVAESMGFVYCGKILCASGDERVAFQLKKDI